MAIIKEAKRNTIMSNGIDTTSLIDKSAYRGIEYTRTGNKEAAKLDPNNYMLGLPFPVITCDKNGNLTSNYVDKDNMTQLAHGYTTATVEVNMATKSDIEAVIANEINKDKENVKDMFENMRSKEGIKGVPVATNTVTLGGKTTFEIDAEALAKVSAKERGKDTKNPRLKLNLDKTKATVDGVGKVSPESLKFGLTTIATTTYITSNTGKTENNQFGPKTIADAGEILTAAYDKAVNDVAKALAEGKSLDPIKSIRTGESLDKTALANGRSVKIINVDGVNAFVQKPGADAAKVKDDMRDIAKVITERANKYASQDAYINQGKVDETANKLIYATNFEVASIPLKQTDNEGVVKSAGVVVLSPSIAGTITPTASSATRIHTAVKAPTLEETKAAVIAEVFDEAERMAISVLGDDGPQRTKEQARAAQNAVIDKVKEAVDKAGKNYDSVGKEAKAGGKKGPKDSKDSDDLSK